MKFVCFFHTFELQMLNFLASILKSRMITINLFPTTQIFYVLVGVFSILEQYYGNEDILSLLHSSNFESISVVLL